jgi:membrane associated rhomboid family serine protease
MAMEALAMAAEPVAEPVNNRLAAAILLVDPAVRVLERRPDHVLLASGPLRFLVVEPETAAALDDALASARERLFKHPLRGVIFVNTARLEARQLLEHRKLPGVVWAPGGPVERALKMMAWHPLELALVKLDVGEAIAVEPIFHEREQANGERDRFLEPLLARRPFVTWSIAGLSVVLFGLQLLWGDGTAMVPAGRMGAGVPSLIRQGELWRVLAPTVLHGSPTHLAMNMIALFGFGTFLERLLGWRRYLLLYVVSGLAGSLGSVIRSSDVVSVGASGGIWGLMVAGAVLVTWPRGQLPDLLAMSMRRRAWSPIVINALYSLQPGIDLLAHFGGGLAGGALMFSGVLTLGLDPAKRRREPIVLTAAAVACALAVLASVGVAIAMGRPWELNERPPLSAVQAADATISLPHMMGGIERKELNANLSLGFGSLRYDPIFVSLLLGHQDLSPEELANPEAALRGAIDVLGAPEVEGFTANGGSELLQREGRPYLHFSETAADGRALDGYWLIEGGRLARVMVFTTQDTSPAWRAVAGELPFTLHRDQPARSPKTQE